MEPQNRPAHVLVAIDAPDPDNFALIIAMKRLYPNAKMWVMVTGRPVRFNATKEHANWQWDVRDSRMALEASAARIRNFVRNYGVRIPEVYDGGIAPRTLIPHHVHFAEYYKYLDVDPLAAIAHSELVPQDELVAELLACPERSVLVAVGGPMTGIAQLMARNPLVGSRFSELHAMFATWGTVELMQFDGPPRGALQFNVACDPQAAYQVLTGLACPIYLLPSEVTRVAEIGFDNAQELRQALEANEGNGRLYLLYCAWYDAAVLPRRNAQIEKNQPVTEKIFVHDVSAGLSSDPAIRAEIYDMVPIEIVSVPHLVGEAADWGKVIMRQTDGPTNRFAARSLTERGAEAYLRHLRATVR